MRFQYRSVVTVILASLFTCGIYPIYWLISTQNALRNEYRYEDLPSGGMVLLLTFVTCGIHHIYWMYKTAIYVNQLMEERGLTPTDDVLLLVLLGVCLTPIAFDALIQSKINMMV